MTPLVVLKGVAELRGTQVIAEHHPGLTLDKYSFATEQADQKSRLAEMCNTSGDEGLLRALHARHTTALKEGTASWTATTAGPLTLHLSRANALENAGIALHPLYGFAYLPGSGLKGAARAYAETIWLQTIPAAERVSASSKIVEVFGCAPRSDAGKDWLPEERRVAEDGRAGAVVFHDALPIAWPKLFVDIAAVHHPKYYQANDNSVPPPGDWETPSLISFLAITPGTEFRFVLSPRSSGPRPDGALVGLAQHWLNGALVTLGVGAKTATSYGRFDVKDFSPAALPSGRAEAQFDLTLVTPAFLAGSAQGEEDCDLRGATLRGQLRWWWRTMHTAHLEPGVLRRLEAAVWGASREGSAVQVHVTGRVQTKAVQFNFKTDRSSEFLDGNGIAPSNWAVPESETLKTTQGLYYAAYGATPYRAKGVDKPGRFFRQPGSTWNLRLVARASAYRREADGNATSLPADLILQQASAALFLLTRYGGVGAKARKGFGSFADVDVAGIGNIRDCQRLGAEFREKCGLTSRIRHYDAPSLELMSEPIVVDTSWSNAWFALNRIGEGMQAYAKTGKHKPWKAALGLPRKSDHASAVRVKDETMLCPTASIPWIGKLKLDRHAAPAHFHVAKTGDKLTIRLVTFVSQHLPDEATSRDRLGALRIDVRNHLEACKNEGGEKALSPKSKAEVGRVDEREVRVGTVIQAELLEERTAKGGWRAKHIASGDTRSIQNSHMVPKDKRPGDRVSLEVPSRTEFKWPVPTRPPPAPPPRHGGSKGRR